MDREHATCSGTPWTLGPLDPFVHNVQATNGELFGYIVFQNIFANDDASMVAAIWSGHVD